ncbi:hypothetical protein MSG28_011398 [Choristoneura fumiferana]|uniref:Uncharacterized protein n=1 Tax=Choristoneura fumiferana TaxID=7141 RepID=A0ACC0JNV4_CHOFU|nr:hypothetical protein MSG28_011398 [Choristoneura fumiferana]
MEAIVRNKTSCSNNLSSSRITGSKEFGHKFVPSEIDFLLRLHGSGSSPKTEGVQLLNEDWVKMVERMKEVVWPSLGQSRGDLTCNLIPSTPPCTTSCSMESPSIPPEEVPSTAVLWLLLVVVISGVQ